MFSQLTLNSSSKTSSNTGNASGVSIATNGSDNTTELCSDTFQAKSSLEDRSNSVPQPEFQNIAQLECQNATQYQYLPQPPNSVLPIPFIQSVPNIKQIQPSYSPTKARSPIRARCARLPPQHPSYPSQLLSPFQKPNKAPPAETPAESSQDLNDFKPPPAMIIPLDAHNVKVLFDGYSKFVDGDYYANCTTTLIKGGPNIIVDTMTSWDEDKLGQAIYNEGLNFDDINFVICTHAHSDHIGCNHLFKKAIHIVGFSVSHRDLYYFHPDFRHGEEYNINPSCNNIKVIPTPGHTMQDVSVIVYTTGGIVAITGDLFEKAEDLDNDMEWLLAGTDNDRLQRNNRKKILQLADYIIPGHGPMFKVPDMFKNLDFKKN